MNSKNRSTNHLTILMCLAVLMLVTLACSLPFNVPREEPPEEFPPPEEPFQGKEPWEGEHPPEEPMPGEPMHEEPMPDEPPPPGEEPPPEPGSGEPPPPQPAPQQPSGGGGGPFTTDVAVTDIYPGNKPHGQFHVRITNNGPGTLNKVTGPVVCAYDRTDKNSGAKSYQSATTSVTLSMKPGETMSFPTTLSLDTNVFEYRIACEVLPNFNDPNPGNNVYNEWIK